MYKILFTYHFLYYAISHNGLQICDVAVLVALYCILPIMFISERMFDLPLNPPYSQMCCYVLVKDIIANKTFALRALPSLQLIYLYII